jgi:hypothetical protein
VTLRRPLPSWIGAVPVFVVFVSAGVAFLAHTHSAARAEVEIVAARLELGDSKPQVREKVRQGSFRYVSIVERAPDEWLVGYAMWPWNWIIWVEFREDVVTGLRVRLVDDRDFKVPETPPDRISPAAHDAEHGPGVGSP